MQYLDTCSYAHFLTFSDFKQLGFSKCFISFYDRDYYKYKRLHLS